MELHGSEYQTLVSRLKGLTDDGVVDVKFCLRNQKEANAEDACREVNEMLLALANDETELVEPAKPRN
jgi:hypothetical protein